MRQDAGSDLPANNLLRRLSNADFNLLKPHLQTFSADAHEQLYSPGENVEIVYFPCGPTLVSFLVTNADGRDVDTILVGREGAVGGIVSHGNLPAYAKIVVKFGGTIVRMKVTDLEAAKLKSATLRNLFARYADCLLAQVLQSTACNAIHSIEQRTAKWILAAMERAGDDILPLTQEQLAFMLGVGRSYASRVVQSFKAEGIIDTGRGALIVRDKPALAARACLCNESVKTHFEIVLAGVYPDEDD
ncbi:MAG: Crp/Fnr family transcriptional regulator [Hyphomicrobiaceae bacterium]|nr:Crp/Fnr family transcriptional regulator [Hyphomicrobiaceae bacterium]